MDLQSVWGWEPALYLFLGGLGAGTFVATAVIYLATKGHRKALSIAAWSAAACLVVGLLLLLADVVKPFQAMLMWQSFVNVSSSWMAIGAWLLFAAVLVIVIFGFAITDKLSGKFDVGVRKGMANVCAVIGAVLCLGVAVYTGILLKSAPGVPFWNCGFLPALFTVSALDTGVALVAIIMACKDTQAHGIRRGLEIATVVLVLVEVCVLCIFLVIMLNGGNSVYAKFNADYAQTATACATALISGELAVWFWGLVVVLGLALPLTMALISVFAGKCAACGEKAEKCGKTLALAGAAGALIGGCALRFIVLLAGCHADILIEWAAELL